MLLQVSETSVSFIILWVERGTERERARRYETGLVGTNEPTLEEQTCHPTQIQK